MKVLITEYCLADYLDDYQQLKKGRYYYLNFGHSSHNNLVSSPQDIEVPAGQDGLLISLQPQNLHLAPPHCWLKMER